MLLNGKTAVVTGAAGGLGQAISRGLMAAGARVAMVDVVHDPLAEFSEQLTSEGLGAQHATFECDIADAAACELAMIGAVNKLGPVDILVNNAAMGMQHMRLDHMTKLVTIDEIEPDVWKQFIDVNLSGSFYMTRAAVPGMIKQKRGSIINVTTSFFTMLRGSFHPYGPSKAGMEAMAAGHAKEFAPHNVSVNVVVPGGPADTDMVPDEAGFDRADLVPPAAMVPPIVWLGSDQAANVTGNRYIAADWNSEIAPREAARGCEAPIAWPGLAGAPVWPGGKPDE